MLSGTRLAIATVALAAVAFPTTALGADSRGARVVRIDAATSAQTVLAAGAPLKDLYGIAVDSSGIVYVAGKGGSFSLTAPGFSPVATTNPAASADDQATVGSTVYRIEQGDCSGETNSERTDTTLVTVDGATGATSVVTPLGCDPLSGLTAAADGTLLAARGGTIIRINPATEDETTVAKGGSLKDVRDIAMTASGDLVVADAVSGLLRISLATGAQTKIASGGDLTGATAVAVDASGTIYAAASGPASLKASAASRQRFSKSGISFSASCSPGCAVQGSVSLTGTRKIGSVSFGTRSISATRSLKAILFDGSYDEFDSPNEAIRRALRNHKVVKAHLTLTPVDTHGIAQGKSVKLTVRLVR